MNPRTFASRAAAAIVAAVAGFASYRHIYQVATGAGEHPTVAAVLPLAVDGLILVGTLALLEDKRHNRHPRMSARVALGFGVLATLAANVASAQPTLTARLVAAVPAVSFLLAVEVLSRTGKPRAATAAEPADDRDTMPVTLAEPATVDEAVMIEPANGEAETSEGVDVINTLPLPGDLTTSEATDPREAAREAYRQSVDQGAPLSGAAIGRLFDRSARWGVDRVNEVRREMNGRIPIGTP